MKVVATRKVCYNGKWYDAGECFECAEHDFNGLVPAGVEAYKENKVKKADRAIKEVKERADN